MSNGKQKPGSPAPAASAGKSRLTRLNKGAVLSGVCIGLAQRAGVPTPLVRLAFVAAIPLLGLGVLAYLVLRFVMAKDPVPPPPVTPLFRRIDWISAAVTTALVLIGYLITLAPDMTLEDSGELSVASHYAGVPHPPG